MSSCVYKLTDIYPGPFSVVRGFPRRPIKFSHSVFRFSRRRLSRRLQSSLFGGAPRQRKRSLDKFVLFSIRALAHCVLFLWFFGEFLAVFGQICCSMLMLFLCAKSVISLHFFVGSFWSKYIFEKPNKTSFCFWVYELLFYERVLSNDFGFGKILRLYLSKQKCWHFIRDVCLNIYWSREYFCLSSWLFLFDFARALT